MQADIRRRLQSQGHPEEARMRLVERLLLALSRAPGADNGSTHWTLENALARLDAFFPELRSALHGSHVLDFGSGDGYQSAAMAQTARQVVGVDSNRRVLNNARARWALPNLSFLPALGSEHHDAFDVVVSQDSFEHFSDPLGILRQFAQVLKPGGKVYLTFSPLWFSPFGAHMQYFTGVPWVHLLFSERTVMTVRSRYRQDGARRYEDVEGGLNRMSLRKFESLPEAAGLSVVWCRYRCVKDLPLSRIPGVRELFVERVDCILQRGAALK